MALRMFVCTYSARLANLNVNCKELGDIVRQKLCGTVVAMNNYFTHATSPGYEDCVKHYSFRGSVEIIMKLDKIYKVKCIPSGGIVQIPGVTNLDDGRLVLKSLIDYFKHVGFNNVVVLSEKPYMLNYTFQIGRAINIYTLADNLKTVTLVRNIKFPLNYVGLSFGFMCKRLVRVFVFQTGKINIRGADSHEDACKIYAFFIALFKKRVQFDDKPPTVHIVGGEDRKGIWEQYVIDRCRFKRRIEEAEKMLSREYFERLSKNRTGRLRQTKIYTFFTRLSQTDRNDQL